MNHRRILVGALAVLACAGLALVPGSADAAPASAMVSGGGHYANPGFGGVLPPTTTQFGISGRVRDGVADGQGTSATKAWGADGHFKVLHLSVTSESNGPVALIVGEFTTGSWGILAPFFGTSDATGWRFINAVQDRGNGKKSDYASDAAFFPPGTPVAFMVAGFGAARIAVVNDPANTRVITGNVNVRG